ncbi:MAG: NAD(P)/FAD-dependent oxidoreductase [Firmicutes bacterium]|nr:NAD(P)/FAD-dependent oxidoreductase [Bacillota bacterium]
MSRTIIMGAGPAGLAAGYRLSKNGEEVALLEADSMVGGISKTIQYRGYYFDLGGHRFFTKFNEVNEFWNEILGGQFVRTPRLSRIYYRNKFFNYPLTPMNALFGVGLWTTFVITGSYIKSRLFPYPEEDTFEQWVSNRFGKKLYSIFFKTYTEKVWGIPCSKLGAEWSAQRIKGLSLSSAIVNALFKPKNTKIKTLIDEFHYPVHGPGMMYTAVKNRIEMAGGQIFLNSRVVKVKHRDFKVQSVEYLDEKGASRQAGGDYFISSIPITELVFSLDPLPEERILEAARNLKYRSFLTVDLIINKKTLFPDNWIYIHSPEVKLGRIQNFKNWSSKMVPDPEKTSLGLEYFCNENDELWRMPDQELFQLAAKELERIKICSPDEIEDFTVVRVPKAYPVYEMGYQDNIAQIKDYLKKFTNLQAVGRYGLFKYNNMDHSILTGFYAAQNILEGKAVYDTWEVNTEEEYHEEKKAE